MYSSRLSGLLDEWIRTLGKRNGFDLGFEITPARIIIEKCIKAYTMKLQDDYLESIPPEFPCRM